jgi:spastic paraplegia protein 7
MLAKGEVDHLVVHPDMETVTVVLHDGAVIRGKRAESKVYHMNMPGVGDFEEKLREAESKLGIAPEAHVPIVFDRSSDFLGRLIVTMVAVTIIGIVLSSMMSGRGGSSAASSASKGTGIDYRFKTEEELASQEATSKPFDRS